MGHETSTWPSFRQKSITLNSMTQRPIFIPKTQLNYLKFLLFIIYFILKSYTMFLQINNWMVNLSSNFVWWKVYENSNPPSILSRFSSPNAKAVIAASSSAIPWAIFRWTHANYFLSRNEIQQVNQYRYRLDKTIIIKVFPVESFHQNIIVGSQINTIYVRWLFHDLNEVKCMFQNPNTVAEW